MGKSTLWRRLQGLPYEEKVQRRTSSKKRYTAGQHPAYKSRSRCRLPSPPRPLGSITCTNMPVCFLGRLPPNCPMVILASACAAATGTRSWFTLLASNNACARPCFSLVLPPPPPFCLPGKPRTSAVHPDAGDSDNDDQQLGVPRKPRRGESRGAYHHRCCSFLNLRARPAYVVSLTHSAPPLTAVGAFFTSFQ